MDTLEKLVNSMIFSGMLKTPHIIDAFTAIDRRYFIPVEYADFTYIDAPLGIGNAQTISQPSTVAFMLEQLDVHKGHKVLDIGSGSGWTTALLCHIVGEEGSVLGLERIDALVEQGRENLARFNSDGRCRIQKAKKVLGMPGEQYDRILVSASADEIPQELFSQLNIGGILVIPVQESIFKFEKIAPDEIKEEEFYGFSFVPLVY